MAIGEIKSEVESLDDRQVVKTSRALIGSAQNVRAQGLSERETNFL